MNNITDKDKDALQQAARPLMDFLRTYPLLQGCSEAVVLVTASRAELLVREAKVCEDVGLATEVALGYCAPGA